MDLYRTWILNVSHPLIGKDATIRVSEQQNDTSRLDTSSTYLRRSWSDKKVCFILLETNRLVAYDSSFLKVYHCRRCSFR